MIQLKTIKYIILSLYIFFKNTKYLKSYIKIIKSLLLLKFKGMIYEAYEKNYIEIFECQI